MRLTTTEIARATEGKRQGPEVTVQGASIDSRRVRGGELFVPIVAERDGHDFVEAALDAGAVAYLTSRPPVRRDVASILVEDTAASLLALGRFARSRLPDRVIGITGSVGKTSTKDLLSAVLGTTWQTAASVRSFNNELGVPLTLLETPDATEAIVVEMGARGSGHIALLADVARPTVGIVTSVDRAHLDMFGTVEAVAAAKGELVEALPSDGLAVLNADQCLVAGMAQRTKARVITFGRGVDSDAEVRAETIVVDAELHPRFRLRSPWGDAEVVLAARGEHQVMNALAALTSALGLGVPLARAVEALERAAVSQLRMDLRTSPDGISVLNDAYNANPASMKAALDALIALDARRRVAVLGPMAELGEVSDAAHAEVAARATSLGVRVVAVDEPAYGPSVEHVADIDGALAALDGLGDGDAVLVKASRVARLERVAAALLEET